MTSTGDQLVEEYLHRFDNASVFLTDERRAELRQEIVEHIAAGVEEAEAAHADAVRAVLDRLGPPADIVASETGSESSGSTPAVGTASPSPGHPKALSKHHDEGGHVPGGSGLAPVVPSRRRRSALLVAGAATVVVLGALAVGASAGDADSGPASVERSTTPSRSDTPEDRPSESESTDPFSEEPSPGSSQTPSPETTPTSETPTPSSSSSST
ncbi:HAAS signaling domain-containing protein [Streptomyces marispadix]|uniref:Uncharacterized protein n=1 Tax=Streptomyces marispadix TaxID=2922868 RepID=A0ABS9T3X8_9ACTN|nr:hypothetical protein [Streptomyces marispadix]MCH6163250.1 hypothetical protein [Streptomyces marispadix]